MDTLAAGTPPFIEKLVSIVQSGPAELVRWAPDGTTWIVVDSKRFEREILPHYFKSTNFTSFVRQLNFYGFHKLPTSPSGYVEFQHAQFQRDRMDLISLIRRKTSSDYQVFTHREVAVLRAENSRLKSEVTRLRRELDRIQTSVHSAAEEADDADGDDYERPVCPTCKKHRTSGDWTGTDNMDTHSNADSETASSTSTSDLSDHSNVHHRDSSTTSNLSSEPDAADLLKFLEELSESDCDTAVPNNSMIAVAASEPLAWCIDAAPTNVGSSLITVDANDNSSLPAQPLSSLPYIPF